MAVATFEEWVKNQEATAGLLLSDLPKVIKMNVEFQKEMREINHIAPPLFILSPPGFGKTAVIEKTAEELNLELVKFHFGAVDVDKVRGVPIPGEDDTVKWLGGQFYKEIKKGEERAKKNGKSGILIFLDDIHLAPPELQALMFTLIEHRRVDDNPIPDNSYIILAGNYSDVAGAQELITPFLKRTIKVSLSTDGARIMDGWIKFLKESGYDQKISPAFLSYAKANPDLITGEDVAVRGTAPRDLFIVGSSLRKVEGANWPIELKSTMVKALFNQLNPDKTEDFWKWYMFASNFNVVNVVENLFNELYEAVKNKQDPVAVLDAQLERIKSDMDKAGISENVPLEFFTSTVLELELKGHYVSFVSHLRAGNVKEAFNELTEMQQLALKTVSVYNALKLYRDHLKHKSIVDKLSHALFTGLSGDFQSVVLQKKKAIMKGFYYEKAPVHADLMSFYKKAAKEVKNLDLPDAVWLEPENGRLVIVRENLKDDLVNLFKTTNKFLKEGNKEEFARAASQAVFTLLLSPVNGVRVQSFLMSGKTHPFIEELNYAKNTAFKTLLKTKDEIEALSEKEVKKLRL